MKTMSQPVNDAALDQLFRDGRSYEGFLDKPVTTGQLEDIWNIMRWGPTSANCLPARLVWCVSQDAKDKLAACAMPSNGDKIKAAPVSVLIGMDTEFYEQLPDLFPYADARAWFSGNAALAESTAFRNSTLQGAYFLLAARALGLDTGPMSGFNNAAADEAFFAGTKVKSNFISMLGYGDPEKLTGRSPRPGFERFNTLL
jgi:3-hydroxypropanoate dehydrogenase